MNSEELVSMEINEEMNSPINNIEEALLEFESSDQKDYKTLAIKLKVNINVLTSICTMKGKSHEELHKWLLPFIRFVNALSESNNDSEGAIQFENIKKSIVTYNQYFE